MAENLVTYCVVHQPRRIKLPAQVIPRGTTPADMAGYLLDDVMNKRYFDKVARWCYHPACQMFLDMLEATVRAQPPLRREEDPVSLEESPHAIELVRQEFGWPLEGCGRARQKAL